jgi:hypothetical protein
LWEQTLSSKVDFLLLQPRGPSGGKNSRCGKNPSSPNCQSIGLDDDFNTFSTS